MRKKYNKGFTAIEVVLALSLLSVIMLAGFNMLVYGFNVFNIGSGIVEQQQSLQQLGISITNDIRISDEVSYENDTMTIDGTVYIFDSTVGIITKDGEIYAKNVTAFSVSPTDGNATTGPQIFTVSVKTKDNEPLIIKAGQRWSISLYKRNRSKKGMQW